jgi:glycyl-tRNA synthetase beta chain
MTTLPCADFLIELGTEELPPKALRLLRDSLRDGVTLGIAEAGLATSSVAAYSTPRRLAVLVTALQLRQIDQEIEQRGPPVTLAFDKNGVASKAAEAFAGKCGVHIDDLSTVKTDKGEWLYYKGRSAGADARDLLPGIVTQALNALPVPRRMRWGSSQVEFVRPVHWLVMLLGNEIVDCEILGLKAGRTTFGHRFHTPEALVLDAPKLYVDTLRTRGQVVVDFDERLRMIEATAERAAQAIGGRALIKPEVAEEISALVEWPVPIVGKFDTRFLQLPPEVLISTLQDHQRYFPVQNAAGLMPAFIAFSNLASKNPDEIRRGNERVVLPRFSDAAFFWEQDIAVPLEQRQEQLKDVVYQKGLGTLHDKSRRVGQLAALLGSYFAVDLEQLDRASALARTDLLTAMVGEFPELQGRMGYYYARHDGEHEEVAVAIDEQYLPRHAGDRLPVTPVGQALSLADRLDTLAGIFALGQRPSGTKDPFGLRRQALGLVRVLVEGAIEVDLPALLAAAVELQPVKDIGTEVATDLYDFIMERMRAWYLTGQAPDLKAGDITTEMFSAVLSRAPSSPFDFDRRLRAVQAFMTLDSADSLAAANKRIANILRKAGEISPQPVVAELFEQPEEASLHQAVSSILPALQADLRNRKYASVLQRLAGLRIPVDTYFDKVMVMADDSRLRNNRLAQLRQLRELFLDIADLSFIPGSR